MGDNAASSMDVIKDIANRLVHWLWKSTRLDIECDYYCGTCPYYDSCCHGEEVDLSSIHYQNVA